jgi:N-methylhydantoinase B
MSTVPMSGLDGATVEVVRSYLASAVEQARRTLVRTAFNPVIYEVLDFGVSLYDRQLRLIAEAPGITHFLGANDYAIVKGVEYVGAHTLRPGDVVMLNYPYWNSAHTYDAMLFAPIFLAEDGEIAAYLCVRAHWMDLGGKDAAYVLDSTDMHQEGLVFPGTRIVKGGQIDNEILELIRFNSRLPDLTIGDFHAQLSAIRVGEQRVRQVYEKFGADTVAAAIEAVLDHGERTVRRALADLPDGTWTATDWLDDDGISTDPVEMQVTIRIEGEEISFDFSGSSPAVPGPINMPFGATESLAKVTLKGLVAPNAPNSAGLYRTLTVTAPPGTLFHAVYPAATFTLWTSMGAHDLIHKALAQAIEGVGASSGADEPGFMATGVHPETGEVYVISNNEGIGWGGTPEHDGSTALQHASTSVVRNTPIEVLEHKAALLHERLALRPDSGGAGRHRGGLGIERTVRFTADGEVLSMKKKTRTRPWGLAGGLEALTNGMTIHPGTAKERTLAMRRAPMPAGARFVNVSAGGGGYGDPLDRSAEAVVQDVIDGYVSPDAARDVYGVIVRADGTWEPSPARRAREREAA